MFTAKYIIHRRKITVSKKKYSHNTERVLSHWHTHKQNVRPSAQQRTRTTYAHCRVITPKIPWPFDWVKNSTPIIPVLENVHANFGFHVFLFRVRIPDGTDGCHAEESYCALSRRPHNKGVYKATKLNWIEMLVQLGCTDCKKKSALMLMRRARAYSSSCSQVVLVYVHLFCLNPLFCSRKSQKITKNAYLGNSRSFKIIDVDTTKKYVTSACYDTCLLYTSDAADE